MWFLEIGFGGGLDSAKYWIDDLGILSNLNDFMMISTISTLYAETN